MCNKSLAASHPDVSLSPMDHTFRNDYLYYVYTGLRRFIVEKNLLDLILRSYLTYACLYVFIAFPIIRHYFLLMAKQLNIEALFLQSSLIE